MRYSYRLRDNNINIDKIIKVLGTKNYIYDEENPELVLVFGGDGTVLGAVQDYVDKVDDIIFIGINHGNLGFYTDFIQDDIENILNLIENNEYDIANLPLVEYHIINNQHNYSGYALNEISLISVDRTMIMEIFINGLLFEKFRGTGIAVATPSGSTAYNKSLGGAVVDVNIPSMQLTEIASINNQGYTTLGSPIILGRNSSLKRIPVKNNALVFNVDNRHLILKDNVVIETKVSDKCVKLLTQKNRSFFKRVQKAFIGEVND
jgi:NAD+ kinase